LLQQNFSGGKIPQKAEEKPKAEPAAQKPTAAPKADEPIAPPPPPAVTKIHIEPKIEPKPEKPLSDFNPPK
jgi:hypothetical protein